MKNIIHYAFILDQSGSMCNLKKEVITGFKEQVETIRKMNEKNPDVEIKVTLCLFNDVIDFKYIDQRMERLKPLTPNEYFPNSITALYDALGTTMVKLKELVKDSEKVFIAVFTDGLENASKEFSSTDIKKLLAGAEDDKWEVRFFCDGEDRMF